MTSDRMDVDASLDDVSSTIVNGYLFVDEVGVQIEALRETLKRQIDRFDKTALKIRISDSKEDWANSESGWAVRTNIDTFVVKKSGPSAPVLFAAYQIGIGPVRKGSERDFYPYLAVLLAGDASARNLEQWQCEEFQLDEEYLASSQEWDNEPWLKQGDRAWGSKDGLDVALVIPLADLKSEVDTLQKVVLPMFSAIDAILRVVRTSPRSDRGPRPIGGRKGRRS